jgi:hypothetical protein
MRVFKYQCACLISLREVLGFEAAELSGQNRQQAGPKLLFTEGVTPHWSFC